MKITHNLYLNKTNVSYFLECPMCGSDFKEMTKEKLIEDMRRKKIAPTTPAKQKIKKSEIHHCSNCSFEIQYNIIDDRLIILLEKENVYAGNVKLFKEIKEIE